MSAEPAYLICYDIADPRRLQRVHYYLKARALAVQYSVFFGRFSRERLDRLLSELPGIIKAAEDDVRIYPVPEQCAARQIGEGGLPDWFVLAGDDIPRFLESYWKPPARPPGPPPAPWTAAGQARRRFLPGLPP